MGKGKAAGFHSCPAALLFMSHALRTSGLDADEAQRIAAQRGEAGGRDTDGEQKLTPSSVRTWGGSLLPHLGF